MRHGRKHSELRVAGLTIAAQHAPGRLALEKLLRYCGRLPIAQDRLTELPDGRIALTLKTPWSDGTTHVIHEPLDLIAKLSALIPRPHKNLVIYHGVLAANAAWRERVIGYGRDATSELVQSALGAPRRKRMQWADLTRRAFGYDLLTCPNCGGKMQLLASMKRRAIRKILSRLGLPTDLPATAPARASPDPWEQCDTNRVMRGDLEGAGRRDPSRTPRNPKPGTTRSSSRTHSCALPRGK